MALRIELVFIFANFGLENTSQNDVCLVTELNFCFTLVVEAYFPILGNVREENIDMFTFFFSEDCIV
jgi:hypothetical protein